MFTFLREFENLNFVEVVQRLAERASIPIEFEMTPGQREEHALLAAHAVVHLVALLELLDDTLEAPVSKVQIL